MIVCTIKWNKKTAVLLLIAIAVLLVIFVLALGRPPEAADGRIESAGDASGFLESLGWTVDPNSVEEKIVVIPEEFSAIYDEYNDMQKASGYDLSDYCGKQVTIYTLSLKNYPDYNGNVVSDVYVYKGKIIGGDIHSLEFDGFMHGLCRNAN